MKIKKSKSGNSERWLLTYSDLITLLMILFILLFAISNVNQSKYEKLAESLKQSLGTSAINNNHNFSDGSSGVLSGIGSVLPGGGEVLQGTSTNETDNTSSDTQTDNTTTDTQNQQENNDNQIQTLKSDINKIITDNNLQNDISTNSEDNGLIITFPSSVFFDSGKATLKTNMKKAMDIIAVKLNEIDNDILVKGYTDNVPIKDGEFTSNWQLSAVRAANVVQYLIEERHVASDRLMAVGCGDNDPIESNATVQGRNKNRRIEMVILNKGNWIRE